MRGKDRYKSRISEENQRASGGEEGYGAPDKLYQVMVMKSSAC